MTTVKQPEALMALIEAYADARHKHGAPEYNAHTAAARTAVLHALTTHAGADGWVSVPVELTPEMRFEAQDSFHILPPRMKRLWKAMLAAAPTQPKATCTVRPALNEGHGHVFERPDGVKARCGGPKLCMECARDLASRIVAESKIAAPPAPEALEVP